MSGSSWANQGSLEQTGAHDCSDAGAEASGFRRISGKCAQFLQNLKSRLTRELAAGFFGILSENQVRQMVSEADSLAATTGFPALFLPTLAEEKVLAASNWQLRQRAIRERSLVLAA